MGKALRETKTRNGWWIRAFWFAGVVLFMMELGAGLNYVELRLTNFVPNFLDAVPALGLAAWKITESAFWNYGQIEATFRVLSLVAMPFALMGLAMMMKGSTGFRRQRDNG